MKALMVRAAVLATYEQVALRYGLEPAKMLRNEGLPSAALNNTEMRISAARFFSLLEHSAEMSGCQTFGLQMAELRPLSTFGALSLLLTHQPTLRDVISTILEYMHLSNQAIAARMEEGGDLITVQAEVAASVGTSTRQAIEIAAGTLCQTLRNWLGPTWTPYGAQFTHSAPGDLSVHRRVFGSRLTFNAQFNGVFCERRDLDRENPSADPVMARYAREFIEAMPGGAEHSLEQEVRSAIYVLLPMGHATLEQVAFGMGMTPRALQRHLGGQRTNFSELLKSVRRALIERYLDNPRYSLTQIGAMLGFAHSSAFSRWHRSAFGKPPTKARLLAR